MPLRQQDSVCAQIIPCSSWLFSIFLNRHCTESGIRNGPVISLIASTDKSKMGKFFQRHNWLKPQMLLKELSASSPTMVWTPLNQPSPQGWARTQMAERAAPPDKTHLRPAKASIQNGKARKWKTACSWASVLLLPWSWPQVGSTIYQLGSRCATKDFCTPETSLRATNRLHTHTSTTADTTNQPTQSQIWQISTESKVLVFPTFYWNSPNSFY